jgi:Putative prokaryotic signal transducing protein
MGGMDWGSQPAADLKLEVLMVDPRETALTPRPEPNEKLVKVFDTEEESEAMVVKGLLESAGIECNMTATSTAQDTFPGLGGVVLMVREEDAEPARRVLAESKQSPASSNRETPDDDDDETCEINVSIEEPPAKA